MIRDDVKTGHLARHPRESQILSKLENDFDVTWASRISRFNTELSIYFLKPLAHISQAFGFDQEVIVAISDYPTLEARTIQAVEGYFHQFPAKGRADQTAAFIVSLGPNTEQ